MKVEPTRRLVVVAPHPDDEVLALGGLLAAHPRSLVVAVTDGEGSHPRSRAVPPQMLAARRCAERREALRRIGRTPVEVVRLGHCDGGIDEPALTEQLARMLTADDLVAVTARFDGHPDHEATGRAAAAAARCVGARLWEYPVWTWHWAVPHHPDVPWERARRLPMPASARAAKARAVAAFTSQIAPLAAGEPTVILPPHVLAHFARPFEVVFVDAGDSGAG